MSRSSTRWGLALAIVLLASAALLGFAREPGAASPDAISPSERALRVDAQPYTTAEGYERTGRFVGRIEFARESDLSFELGGRVAKVLVEEGETVDAGAVLARLDTQRLEAARAERVAEQAEARAERDLARLRDQRARRLVEEDVISPQDADDTRLALAARESALARVRARIASIDVDLDKATLRAPFAGRVATREVDEGVVVDAGAPVLRLLETLRPEVRVGVPRHVAASLAEGQEKTVHVSGDAYAARVRSILPERSTGTRTVAVVLTLDASDAATPLRNGDLAELRWREPVATAGAWLPRSALTEGARGLWAAYVAAPADDAHRLERRPVELLHEEGDRVFVRGAIRPGEWVVQSGVHRLVPEQAVLLGDERGAL